MKNRLASRTRRFVKLTIVVTRTKVVITLSRGDETFVIEVPI
jgi:hypothetical protein